MLISLLLLFLQSHSENFAKITVGSNYTITIPPESKIRKAKDKILYIEDQNNNLIVTGRSVGTSWIQVNGTVYHFKVVSRVEQSRLKTIRQKIKSISDVRISNNSSGLLLKGTVWRFKDWIKISKIDHSFGLKLKIRKYLQPRIRKWLLQKAELSNIPRPSVYFEPHLHIAYAKNLENVEKKINRVFSSYGIPIHFESSEMTYEPLVKVSIVVAEINKTHSRTLGIDWSDTYSLKTIKAPQLLAVLNAAENTGAGRVLAKPQLLSRHGKKSSFLAGGEFPIKIMNYKTKNIIWKPYGVRLSILPTTDYSGKIKMELECEVSHLDFAHAIDGLPTVKTNRFHSHIDIKNGSTISLSGLIKHNQGNDIDKVPGLSSLPLLGELFKSKAFRTQKTELVFFVTPELIDPNTENIKPATERFENEFFSQ